MPRTTVVALHFLIEYHKIPTGVLNWLGLEFLKNELALFTKPLETYIAWVYDPNLREENNL